jgi:3-methyl-2-oxobutanoate hydroxymethyltransferase
VLECIPKTLAGEISRSLEIPVIGIGAGPECDGQVLVLYDMLGITTEKLPRFCKNFLQEAATIEEAVAGYVRQVKDGGFPGPEQSYE